VINISGTAKFYKNNFYQKLERTKKKIPPFQLQMLNSVAASFFYKIFQYKSDFKKIEFKLIKKVEIA